MLTRPQRRLGAVTQGQLGEDTGDVILDRTFGDEKGLTDLAVTRAVSQATQNVAFALGQLFPR
jgi:hypothetical protein